ncbi:MAG TPA: pyridoxal 5'-phosphate synthase glutaminase subunit PdxT [Mycobacteriales bacterium]|nr:pyridoxal 5'-phosphate synthase glutaminase subunit PdxT [Mycobacteriales bacterium]
MSSSVPVIGVLALQGDVREHVRMLAECGARAVSVRRPHELDDLDGIVIPGGESTTIIKLADTFELSEPLRKRLGEGLPAFGTCAGMIMLADRIVDGTADQQTFGGMDMTVRRNAFGRQIDSFEADVALDGLDPGYHAVFIRAPWVEELGPGVEPLGRVESGPAAGRIVAVRDELRLATSFHPEITHDARVHALFVEMVKGTS